MKRKVKIGIDLGGSHVGVGVVDTKGNIIEIHEKDFTVEEKLRLIDVAIEYIVEIINELKNKGYKVGLLSNLRLMDYKRYEQQIGKINFDYIFLSYKMKCIKPSNDIYLQVINTLKCDPDNIIFFDDNEKNVNIANQLGINAYQVTGENIKEVFYKKINI